VEAHSRVKSCHICLNVLYDPSCNICLNVLYLPVVSCVFNASLRAQRTRGSELGERGRRRGRGGASSESEGGAEDAGERARRAREAQRTRRDKLRVRLWLCLSMETHWTQRVPPPSRRARPSSPTGPDGHDTPTSKMRRTSSDGSRFNGHCSPRRLCASIAKASW